MYSYERRSNVKRNERKRNGIRKTNSHFCNSLFRNCKNTTQINNINRLDTSNVTNMESMFHGCTSLVSIDVSSFDTSREPKG